MPRIVRVGMLSEYTLDVQLSNDSMILLNLSPLLKRPEYEALLEDDRICYPRTDGECVYWKSGPRLELKEIVQLLQIEINNEEENKQ